jgi:hypothetical protein
MRKLFKSQKGSSLVLFAVSATVLLGFVAMVSDIGMMTLHKSRLSNAVDSAALAGAQELVYDIDNAQSAAVEYLNKNGYSDASVNVEVGEENTAVRVTASYKVKFGIARILGYDSETVSATAKGKILPVVSVNKGIRPFAIQDQILQFGVDYTLKEGAGDGISGNYAAIGLGGSGADLYYTNITEGYNQKLTAGDSIYTETGNISGNTEDGVNQLIDSCPHVPQCTFDHFVPDCPRVIPVIMIDNINVTGHSPVTVMGFASFFLENVAGTGNDSIVTGRFIEGVASGEVSEEQTDYGLYGVRLMQ